MENKILKLIRFTSAVAHITCLAALAMGSNAMFFLPIMSWSFLFFLSSDNQIRESNSILLGDLKKIGSLLASALLFGSILELSNLILGHHYYVGVPAEIWIRWPFYIVSFAAIIPLILELERKLENLGLAEVLIWKKINITRGRVFFLLAAGLLLLIPLFMLPSNFYPLFWIILLLLTDPVVYLLGHDEKSVIGQLEEAYYGQAFRLILAGICFGFLWEFWNFWAESKWFYNQSEFDQAFLFELPVLEIWGYAFTALGAYAFYQLILALKEKLFSVLDRNVALVVTILGLILVLAAVMSGMDAVTAVSFRQVM